MSLGESDNFDLSSAQSAYSAPFVLTAGTYMIMMATAPAPAARREQCACACAKVLLIAVRTVAYWVWSIFMIMASVVSTPAKRVVYCAIRLRRDRIGMAEQSRHVEHLLSLSLQDRYRLARGQVTPVLLLALCVTGKPCLHVSRLCLAELLCTNLGHVTTVFTVHDRFCIQFTLIQPSV